MATVGQILTSPESGWKRISDTTVNTNFSYTGTWTDNTPYKRTSVIESQLKFNFTGTRLRVLTQIWSSLASNVSIKIDNLEVEYFSTATGSVGHLALAYEKTNLSDGEHSVIITLKESKLLEFEGIDIDSGGSVLPYKLLFVERVLINSDSNYKKYIGGSWQTVTMSSTPTEADYLNGNTLSEISSIPQTAWLQLTGEVELYFYTENTQKSEVQFSLDTTPFTLSEELGSSFSIIEYTDNPSQDSSVVQAETELYSVYDHISETPEVLVYTELNDDIKVETTTEPFDVYDELGNEVEVLYYTDDTNVNQANLVLEANYSPIDELQGDVEVVTWTSESQESAQRVLEMTAIPKPQFIKLVNPKRLYGALDEIVAVDISKSYRDEVRYLFSDKDGLVWYVWDFEIKSFVAVDISTHSAILKNGMKWNEMKLISTENWRSWEHDYMNIGIFLKDNPRDTITSIVDSVSYKDYLPRNSTKVEKANFYILNTTAKIDLNLVGNTVEGVLSDNDLTRVQYRVLLNGSPYYPINGDFTQLSAPPENINITADSNSIVIDDWNTIRVEFRDFFGTTDYWQTNFIGTYSGLMFKDINGDYYSNEIGEVLKQLDFGVIIAGQTTIEHEVILRNQYGYDVKNINLYTNASSLPNGMSIQFSKSLSPFVSESDLLYTDVLSNNDELSFYVRVKTVLNATPNANGNFDIVVRADKA